MAVVAQVAVQYSDSSAVRNSSSKSIGSSVVALVEAVAVMAVVAVVAVVAVRVVMVLLAAIMPLQRVTNVWHRG